MGQKKGPQGSPLEGSPEGRSETPLSLIHTNKVPNPIGMRVSSPFPCVLAQVVLYEFKADWCDRNGYPIDALAHRSYVRQLRRAGHANRTG